VNIVQASWNWPLSLKQMNVDGVPAMQMRSTPSESRAGMQASPKGTIMKGKGVPRLSQIGKNVLVPFLGSFVKAKE